MVIKDDLLAPTLLPNTALRFNKNSLPNISEDIVTVNGAEMNVQKSDQRASNGVVHFMEEVIYPVPTGSVYKMLEDDNR